MATESTAGVERAAPKPTAATDPGPVDHPTSAGPERSARPGRPPGHGWARRLGVGLLFAVALIAMSVMTVFRYTALNLQADGIQQSNMSVQNVDLFFWGQNRFASVVPLLASPIADPVVNLFVCLLINALCFHGLLLVVSWMGVRLLGNERRWPAVLITFLIFVATAHAVVGPWNLHIMALETQPYSMSWLLTLSSFLMWKRREWWALALGAAMAGVAMGLNPSVVLGAAFLAVIEMVRRRQWLRWPAFGVVWVAWFGVWLVLSQRFGGTGPIPEPEQRYFAFDRMQFIADISKSTGSIIGAFSPTRFVVLLIVCCLCVLALPRDRRADMLPRFALAILFSAAYFTIFAGNPWVAGNLYVFRYFFPVVVTVVICLAAPIAGAALAIPRPPAHRWVRPAVAVGAGLACAAALSGPLVPPTEATVFQQVRATADFARANNVHFISGNYWAVWPTLHLNLVDGRDSAFGVTLKSGGDPAAYLARFEQDLAQGTPRALCIEDTADNCRIYLDYWTKPGWTEVPGLSCPGPTPPMGGQGVPECQVLEYTG
jgi:hypothetical protein